jgi:hypothetical protein
VPETVSLRAQPVALVFQSSRNGNTISAARFCKRQQGSAVIKDFFLTLDRVLA